MMNRMKEDLIVKNTLNNTSSFRVILMGVSLVLDSLSLLSSMLDTVKLFDDDSSIITSSHIKSVLLLEFQKYLYQIDIFAGSRNSRR
jgi:hypothetical protein